MNFLFCTLEYQLKTSMKSLILIIFSFVAALGNVDRWGLVSFDRNPRSFFKCLHLKLENKILDTGSRTAIVMHLTERFREKTEHVKLIVKESQKYKYLNSVETVGKKITSALVDCSNPVIVEKNPQQYLPRVIQEHKFGPILDDILVQWPRKLTKMISLKPDLELLMRFARDSLSDYQSACKTTSSNNFHYKLRMFWNNRAKLFFDGRVDNSYIKHVYAWDSQYPHTLEDPKMFNKRICDDFADIRNPMLHQTDLEELIKLYALRPGRKPGYNYFSQYREKGYTASDKHLEDAKTQFYQIILIYMELLETEKILINGTEIKIVGNEMSEDVRNIAKGGDELFRYVATTRSKEMRLAHQDNQYREGLMDESEFVSMPDLIMLRWKRIQIRISVLQHELFANCN